jgi:hypothetical protein
MTDETANLILEQLRVIRADIASIKDEMRVLRERMSTMEAQLPGLSYLVTPGLGSVLHDIRDLKERVATLEGAT